VRRLLLLIVLLTANLFAGAAPPTVADIAALKALAPGAYQTVLVLRYSSADSGKYAGGGLVNWIAGSSKAAAACSVYVPNSNPARGRWERVSSSIRSAEQCGIHTYDDTISGVTTYPDLAGSGTRMVVVGPTGTASTQSIPAGGALANPTGTIGLTAVNGVLTSAPRSDGAPALSQAIVPTWTGNHTHAVGAASIWAGLGVAGTGNSEYFVLQHDGSTIDFMSRSTGTGTARGFSFGFNGAGGLVYIAPGGALNSSVAFNSSGVSTFDGPTRPKKSALTSGATIAVNANLADFFTLTLATNATLSNPTNGAEGSHFTVRIRQDATGSRLLSYGTDYRFPAASPVPVLSTGANAIDYLSFIYDEVDGKWDFVGNAFNLIDPS